MEVAPKWRFEWNKISSVPEDLDSLEEEESKDSLTIHSASYRKLRLLISSSYDSGIAIKDANCWKETLIITQEMSQILVNLYLNFVFRHIYANCG